jgi:hypothetical protein
MVCKTTPSTQNTTSEKPVNDQSYGVLLGVVLQTILDVYNCFTCIVSLYRSDPTPRKIDRNDESYGVLDRYGITILYK